MNRHHGRALWLACLLTLGACSTGPETASPSPTETTSSPAPTIRDVTEVESFAALEPGTYFTDPDLDPSTPLRVVYEVAEEGWSQWIGATKFHGEDGHVQVSIAVVANLVTHGCKDRSPADPPVGPTVEDLATELADLAPFRVTSAPADVTLAGYQGKQLELTVPDLPIKEVGVHDEREFVGCEGGNLASWIPANWEEPFFGYTRPGYTEEFWILDVEGTRLMIATGQTPDPPAQDLAELRDIVDSIRIGP
ncbi:MAG TPA: hypothetical protein VJ927_12960 [Actinomycetota bacterium]|nr:hypothetical protein [Actinomycetota bacterium]